MHSAQASTRVDESTWADDYRWIEPRGLRETFVLVAFR